MTCPGSEKLNAKDCIVRLCELQHRIQVLVSDASRADCFCGHGCFWNHLDYFGTWENGFRNDGHVITWIEDACQQKIDLKWRPVKTDPPPFGLLVEFYWYPNPQSGVQIVELGRWYDGAQFDDYHVLEHDGDSLVNEPDLWRPWSDPPPLDSLSGPCS